MYASIKDLHDTFGETNIKNLLVDEGDDTPFIQGLKNASSEIDGYLNKRYKTPLKVVPNIVKEWTCTIAYYKRSLEYGTGLTEEKRKRYEDIFRYLKDIAKGEANIPELENDQGQTEKPDGIVSIIVDKNNPKRVITRRQMNGL